MFGHIALARDGQILSPGIYKFLVFYLIEHIIMDKILITGTGRCGTTFLITLFSFLNFDTGYNRDNYKKHIFLHCNAGMEKNYTEKNYILKNPLFLDKIQEIIKDKSINIKTIIIPIRDLKECAASRLKHGKREGGLVKAKDEETQIKYFQTILSNYLYIMTMYELNTIFINFNQMITNKIYLFNKLKNILNEKNINYQMFSDVYDEISLIYKKS